MGRTVTMDYIYEMETRNLGILLCIVMAICFVALLYKMYKGTLVWISSTKRNKVSKIEREYQKHIDEKNRKSFIKDTYDEIKRNENKEEQ